LYLGVIRQRLTVVVVDVLLLLLLRRGRCQCVTDTSSTLYLTMLGQTAHVADDNARPVDVIAVAPSLSPVVVTCQIT